MSGGFGAPTNRDAHQFVVGIIFRVHEHVLSHLDQLVLKPVEGSGGYGILFGPNATSRERANARRNIQSDPRGWIAQPVVQLSTVPTKVADQLHDGMTSARDKVPGMRNRESNGHSDGDHHFASAHGTRSPAESPE